MGKKKKESKKASRKERRALEKQREAEAAVIAAEQARGRRRLLVGIPVLTIAAVLVCWLVLDDTRLVGVVTLVGGLLFLMVALGGLGSSVKPRDRLRSGSIDFGAGRDRK